MRSDGTVSRAGFRIRDTLAREVAAWEADRNAEEVVLSWRFSVDDARMVLPTVYPIPICDSNALTEHSG